jgi:hypothetical protein
MKTLTSFAWALLVAGLGAAPAAAQGDGLAERITALKQSLAQSQQSLRAYQWVETTTVSLKGEVKSTKQQSCYYGADGVLQKLPISASPPPEKKRGLRGAIIANKTEELTDTMKQAVALVKTYVPPNPALLERSKAAGKAGVEMLQPGKVARLNFRDYQLPGDVLGITLDVTSNKLLGINVTTYLGTPSKPVTLDVKMGSLVDGTTYPENIQLVDQADNLTVNIANSGYRKQNG